MATYVPYDLNQTTTIRLSYADQIIEGSFETALNEIVEHRHHGSISCRRIADACRRNVVFMVLSADSRPHFTTIAMFVSGLKDEIASLFSDVLRYASELDLIGKEHFAVDRCKLPSNASKKWSGTHRELEAKCRKLDHIAECTVQRHRERDAQERENSGTGGEPDRAQQYRRKVAELRTFVEQNEKKLGPTGNEQKSNLTDPESATSYMPRPTARDTKRICWRRSSKPRDGASR